MKYIQECIYFVRHCLKLKSLVSIEIHFVVHQRRKKPFTVHANRFADNVLDYFFSLCFFLIATIAIIFILSYEQKNEKNTFFHSFYSLWIVAITISPNFVQWTLNSRLQQIDGRLPFRSTEQSIVDSTNGFIESPPVQFYRENNCEYNSFCKLAKTFIQPASTELKCITTQ